MIPIKKQGRLGYIGDLIMMPLMYALQGTCAETPQRTHRWNNQHLSRVVVSGFDMSKTEEVAADQSAARRWVGPLPIFHIPVLGGWRKFVVLKPRSYEGEWFVGWVTGDAIGVSNIPLSGMVRLLQGPLPGVFFGVTGEGVQIDIDIIDYGEVGQARQYAKVPLL
jgi:hypothetical protein